MKPMKFRKILHEGNVLGWDEIILVHKFVWKNPKDNEPIDYAYEAICDGEHNIIIDSDWDISSASYTFVEFVKI